MQDLVQGYLKFHRHVFPQKKSLYEKLAQGQSPPYLLITCADSRILTNEFVQADAGEVFSVRSIGNIIPLPGSGEHETKAAIEFAVVALKVRDIIICGHSKCGAVKGLIEPEQLANLPTVATWLRSAQCTRERILEKLGNLEGDELWAAAVEENVRVQVGHARLIPCVSKGLEEGTLGLHGWVYEFEHGRVLALNPINDTFIPLEELHPRLEPPYDSIQPNHDAENRMM